MNLGHRCERGDQILRSGNPVGQCEGSPVADGRRQTAAVCTGIEVLRPIEDDLRDFPRLVQDLFIFHGSLPLEKVRNTLAL